MPQPQNNEPLTAEQVEMVEAYANMAFKLVSIWFSRYRGFGYDAIYDACISALVKCARNYDPERGKFSTLLYHSTDHEMKRVIRYSQAKGRDSKIISLDETFDEDDKLNRLNLQRHEDRYGFIETEFLKDIAVDLSEKEQYLLNLYFVKEMGQRDIAKILNISQVHVSRLLKKALIKMRRQAERVG
jgi:RNA polymerase sigma factor (sigma-70 family)